MSSHGSPVQIMILGNDIGEAGLHLTVARRLQGNFSAVAVERVPFTS